MNRIDWDALYELQRSGRTDFYASREDDEFIANAPQDIADLLAVAEAARDLLRLVERGGEGGGIDFAATVCGIDMLDLCSALARLDGEGE